MKYVLFTGLFLSSAAQAATSYGDVQTCLTGLGYDTSGNDGTLVSIPTADTTSAGGHLLVITQSGALKAELKRADKLNMSSIFTAPGQKELIRANLDPEGLADGWRSFGFQREGQDVPSASVKLTAAQSAEEAGTTALKRTEMRTKEVDRDIQHLRESLTVQPDRGRRHVEDGPLDYDLIRSQKEQIARSSENLKACDSTGSAQLKSAALMETARLVRFKDGLDGFAAEQKAVDKCVSENKPISSNRNEPVKQPPSGSAGDAR